MRRQAPFAAALRRTPPTRRSSDTPLRRRPWPAGSGRLSPDLLGCMQHWQQRRGWQAGAPRRAGLPARGPAAARPSPAAAAVPGVDQRPRNMGAGRQPCAPGPPGGCGLLLAGQQLQVRRQGWVGVPVGDARVPLLGSSDLTFARQMMVTSCLLQQPLFAWTCPAATPRKPQHTCPLPRAAPRPPPRHLRCAAASCSSSKDTAAAPGYVLRLACCLLHPDLWTVPLGSHSAA